MNMNSDLDKIKVTLFGAGGRMGSETAVVISQDKDLELVNLVENPDSPVVGMNHGGLTISGDPFKLNLRGTVFCDFTNAKSAVKNAALAVEMECPILIGSTGFSGEELLFIENFSSKIPLMFAPNLSRGIDLLYRLAQLSAKTLGGDFQVEIVELHHKWKLDAPSGTAKALANTIEESGGYSKIPVHSIRMGDITGEHRIIFAGEGETIEITHRASSRLAFAKGVPKAIKFLAQAKPGYYSFRDAL